MSFHLNFDDLRFSNKKYFEHRELTELPRRAFCRTSYDNNVVQVCTYEGSPTAFLRYSTTHTMAKTYVRR